MPTKQPYDFSTINLDVLRSLPKVTADQLSARGLHLQADPGNGCYGDPPGYPTYFTRNVCTYKGNNPHNFADLVLVDPEDPEIHYDVSHSWGKGDTWDIVGGRHKALMDHLYLSLPIYHLRVLGWACHAASSLAHCYVDPSLGPTRRHVDKLLFWPVPYWQLQHFHDDERFSDAWRQKERAAIDQANNDIISRHRLICTVENHALMHDIREIYLGAQINTVLADGRTLLDLMQSPPAHGSDWWERYAQRPTVDECCPPGWCGKHRSEGWCQFCGWVTENGTVTDGCLSSGKEECNAQSEG